MFILLTVVLLALSALALAVLRWTRPDYPYIWLVGAAGALLAWLSVFLWRLHIPLAIPLPSWQPESLFSSSPALLVDGVSWPYSISLVTLLLAVILTAVVRSPFPNPLAWAAALVLTALGLLAVLAENPLTLVMLWTAIDLAELAAQLWRAGGPRVSENVVVAFAARLAGSGILLWASMTSLASGAALEFEAAPDELGLYLLVAAGLRLGVLPLHLPYANDPALRRGVGSILRLVSAASSLVLLARVPVGGLASPLTPWLLTLTGLAALYGGWMWLRARDELSGRPFWIIATAALAVGAALRGNPTGSVAWGIALILAGSPLFLYSVRNKWLTRLALGTVIGLSALPLTPTASGWLVFTGVLGISWLAFLPVQAMLIAGWIRHLQAETGPDLEAQPPWIRLIYPCGLLLPLALHLSLGLWGWSGALQVGTWPASLLACGLAAFLVWRQRAGLQNAGPRFHWVRPPTSAWLDGIYRLFWGLYRLLGRLSTVLSNTMEGDGGILWTLLLLVLFISLLAGGGG
jgi:hypothetical protein